MPPPLLTNTTSILQTFTDFLTVATHTILYERALYPSTSFLSARKYNFPVRQNRHPAVCDWINSSIAHIYTLLQKSSVKRVALVIFSPDAEVLERYLFDIERFPVVEQREQLTDFEERDGNLSISITDVEEQLRASIRMLGYQAGKMAPLQEDCTWTLAVELRDEASPPIGHPQPWVPAEPGLQTGERTSESVGKDLGGVRSMPVRKVEAGEFVLEMWVEEGRAKDWDDGE